MRFLRSRSMLPDTIHVQGEDSVRLLYYSLSRRKRTESEIFRGCHNASLPPEALDIPGATPCLNNSSRADLVPQPRHYSCISSTPFPLSILLLNPLRIQCIGLLLGDSLLLRHSAISDPTLGRLSSPATRHNLLVLFGGNRRRCCSSFLRAFVGRGNVRFESSRTRG